MRGKKSLREFTQNEIVEWFTHSFVSQNFFAFISGQKSSFSGIIYNRLLRKIAIDLMQNNL